MEMVNRFFRKANSLLLAAAMVVTLLPAQTASAAGMEAVADVSALQQGDDVAGSVISQQAAAADDVPTKASIQAKEYYVIEGNLPVLPKKVKQADGSVAQIKWTLDAGLKAGEQIVTGTDGKEQIQVTVNVQPCDEVVADVQATGRKDVDGGTEAERLAAIHPLRGYRGLFVTEYDIRKIDGSNWTDRAVIYLPETANGEVFQGSNAWDFGARLQFKFNHNGTSYFQTQLGDGKVKDNAVYYPMKDEDLRAALDRGEKVERLLEFDEKSTYHVRTVMDTLTDKEKANVKIYVTDPEGIEHEVTQEGGNGFRIYPTDGIVKNFAAVRGGFTMTNHKISWISGYATKKTEIYLKAEGAADYVKEDQVVSTKELPGEISGGADAEIVRDNKVYRLDTEAQSGWYKDGQKYTGVVSADEGQEVVPVYRAYYKYNKAINKTDLDGQLDAVKTYKEEDYTASSWTAFEQALKKANQVKADTTADQDTVDKAKQALETASGKLISIKNLKEAIGALEAELESKKAQKDDYVNWTMVEKAVEDAKKVLNNADANSTQITNAERKLAGTKLITKAEQELADAKNAMESSVTIAEKKLADEKESEYTPASWSALKAALEACKQLNAETATKEEYNTKRETLDLAVQGLTKLADKSALNQAITTAEAKKKTDYEEAGWNKLQEMLTTAKTVAGNRNATQSEVDTAKAALQEAIDKLVEKQASKPTGVKVKTVKRAAKSYQIAAGKKLDLKKVFTVSPGNASNKKLTYSVDKKNYASIKSGVVTVKKAGAGKTVTVKATAADGSGKSATIKIKIMKNAVKKITVKKKSLTVKAGKKVTIKPTVSPSKNVNKKLSYTSSNPNLASVKNGVVTTKKGKKGKVTITIKSTDGSNKAVKVKITIKK